MKKIEDVLEEYESRYKLSFRAKSFIKEIKKLTKKNISLTEEQGHYLTILIESEESSKPRGIESNMFRLQVATWLNSLSSSDKEHI